MATDQWYFTNLGEKWILEYAFQGKTAVASHNMYIGLYTDESFGESNALTLSQITEPTALEWSGYAKKSVAAATWDDPVTKNNVGQIRYGNKHLWDVSDSDTGTGCKVYGAFLTDVASTDLLAIYQFAQAIDIKPNDDDYENVVHLRVKINQGTA